MLMQAEFVEILSLFIEIRLNGEKMLKLRKILSKALGVIEIGSTNCC